MVLFKSEYSESEIEQIKSEFKRLKDHYLDHAGSSLYSEEQIKSVSEYLSKNVFCNPHTSKTTEDIIDQVRYRILKHFNTDSSKYHVVFTSGTTSGLKIVAECFKFKTDISDDDGYFCYVKDNHTSVLGMREIVKTKNISNIEKDELLKILEKNNNSIVETNRSNSLLVVSAQCNFSGYKFPLSIINYVHKNGIPLNSYQKPTNWYVCLDAATFVSTNYLDLTGYKPDFVCISFYKIFGYPTGLGALLVSKEAEHLIEKKYYGGGTVKIALSNINWHRKRDCFHEKLEDGTLPFLSIISLLSGFKTIERLVPSTLYSSSMIRIMKHTYQLGCYLYNNLKKLKYENGMNVIKLYCDTDFTSNEIQGGIVNFNVLHNDGRFVGFAEIACMASVHNILLRTGCFCNPGACQRHLNLSDEDLRKHYKAGHICGDSNDLIDDIPTGSVRISIGYMTTKENIDALIHMIKTCYIENSKIHLIKNDIQKNYKIDSSNILLNKKTSQIKLKTICVYPIKSCGPIKINTEWPLNKKGLLYDREWLIINDNGVALTQKTITRMCLITPKIDLKLNLLELTYPGMESIIIPINIKNNDILKEASLCQSKVCGDNIKGIDCGDEVAYFLSNSLGISGLRLIRQTNEGRQTRKKTNDTTTKLLAFSNQAQFLLINQTSVKWLANKVDDWTDSNSNIDSVIDRFRGNLIFETEQHLEEVKWKAIKIGKTNFKIDGSCTRCQMICIDQNTGEKTTEPYRTIAKQFNGHMKFGIYLSQVYDQNEETEKFITHDYKISCTENIQVDI